MGKLFVIEGIDGSGKSTQFERLKAILSEKHDVTGISFPEYDKPSAALVKMYLNGEFSRNAADVNAYAASTFYAADRYASFKLYWENAYNNGGVILASRYVCSNAIHQMSKLPENEWDGFLGWLGDYEYDKLGLPRPDRTVILDIPVELSQKRLSARYNGDERIINSSFYFETFSGDGFFVPIFGGESRDPEKVRSALAEEIKMRSEKGFDAENFEISKKYYYGSLIKSLESPESIASALMNAGLRGTGDAYSVIEAAANVTLDDLKNCLKTRFDADNSTLSVIRPIEK